jgi:hypothetical protein
MKTVGVPKLATPITFDCDDAVVGELPTAGLEELLHVLEHRALSTQGEGPTHLCVIIQDKESVHVMTQALHFELHKVQMEELQPGGGHR